MKSELVNTQLQNGYLRLALLLLIVWLTLHVAFGQSGTMNNHDYLMPQKGKSMVELYTGVPYVGIAQYSYGFSDRFSVGVFYGLTPVGEGYGIRIKSVLAQSSDHFRINLKAPVIYYPHMKHGEGEAWFLAWPAINAEWKLKNGSRFWIGAGIIGTACKDFIFEPGEKKKMMPAEGSTEPVEGMAKLYNTFQFGYSKPLSNNMSFSIEVAPVMEGFKLKSKSGFLDSFPVIVTSGVSYSF